MVPLLRLVMAAVISVAITSSGCLHALQASATPQTPATKESWHAPFQTGRTLDFKHAYAEAITEYEQALTLVPPADANAKAQVESQIATDYLYLRRFDQAQPYTEDVIALIKKLRTSSHMDPDVLLFGRCLLEAWQATVVSDLRVEYMARHRAHLRSGKMEIALLEALNPKDPSLDAKRSGLARTYIALMLDKECEKYLQGLLPNLDSKTVEYKQVRHHLAAVQAKQGRPQLQQAVFNEMRKDQSESESWIGVGEADEWAANYNKARQSFTKALNTLDHSAKFADREEGRIDYAIASTYLEVSNDKAAEPYLMKAYNVLLPHRQKSFVFEEVSNSLITCLTNQHKTKEAAAVIRPPNSSKKKLSDHYADRFERFGDLLTDEEKKRLKEKEKERDKGK